MSEKKPSETGKIIAMCVLCAICGFGGGVVANLTGIGTAKTTKNETAGISDIFSDEDSGEGDSYSALPFGNNEESDDSDEETETSPFTSGAALGITVQQVTATDDTEGGVYVVSISDESNADDAGVEVGDRIVKADNLEVTGVESLASYILEKDVGDTITLTLKRDDEEFTAEVTLISRNSVTSDGNQKA